MNMLSQFFSRYSPVTMTEAELETKLARERVERSRRIRLAGERYNVRRATCHNGIATEERSCHSGIAVIMAKENMENL